MIELNYFDLIGLLGELKSLKSRIAELKGFIGQLIEAGDAMSNAHSSWVAEEAKWDALVKDWKECEE